MTATTMTTTSWRMFAQRTQRRGVTAYLHIGPRAGWARQAEGDGAYEVELYEDPCGEYYGWIGIDRDGNESPRPMYVSGSREQVAHYYTGGSPAISLDADEAAGRGRVVRLSVAELAPAF